MPKTSGLIFNKILPWEQDGPKASCVADAVPLCSYLNKSKLKRKSARLYHCVLSLNDTEMCQKIFRSAWDVTALSTHRNAHGFSGRRLMLNTINESTMMLETSSM